jgi:hypothetical protein
MWKQYSTLCAARVDESIVLGARGCEKDSGKGRQGDSRTEPLRLGDARVYAARGDLQRCNSVVSAIIENNPGTIERRGGNSPVRPTRDARAGRRDRADATWMSGWTVRSTECALSRGGCGSPGEVSVRRSTVPGSL